MRNVSILFFLVIKISFSCGQNCLWAKVSSGSGFDYSSSVATDNLGNVLITGCFGSNVISFGSFTLSNSSTNNIFLVKYDASGNVLWAKSGLTDGTGIGQSVTTDANQNIYITGVFYGTSIIFDSFTLTNSGSTGTSDVFLVKYDPTGNVIWAKKEGTVTSDASYSVKTDFSQNVYITGYSTNNTLTIGTYTFTHSPGNIFLAKYDSNGNHLWAKTVDATGASYAVTTDLGDNCFITGEFNSPTLVSDSFTLTKTPETTNYFLLKIDSGGNTVWAKNANTIFGYGLCTNLQGDVFVVGSTNNPTVSIGSNSFTNQGLADIFLAKYTSSGNLVWGKCFGTGGNDFGFSISSDVSAIYFTGSFNGTLSLGTQTLLVPSGSNEPMFFARMDFDGNVVYANALAGGGAPFNNVNGISTDSYSNVYLTSDFIVNPLIIGTNTLSLSGGRSTFLAKFHFNDVGLESHVRENENNITVFPNPTSGVLYLPHSALPFDKYVLVDILGKETSIKIIDGSLDISSFPDGIYNLRIVTVKGPTNFKIIKN
jgi:hypothetical protein